MVQEFDILLYTVFGCLYILYLISKNSLRLMLILMPFYVLVRSLPFTAAVG